MLKISGSQIEELTMVDIDDQKKTLKILSEGDYIKCIELNLDADDPYLQYECDDEDKFYDDINEITDDLV